MGSDDRGHSLPKLVGAPSYARPRGLPIVPVERPFDPDDLPLEASRVRGEQGLYREEAPPEIADAAASPQEAPGGPGHQQARSSRLGILGNLLKGGGGFGR